MLRNWYAVYTKPRRERKVSSILTKKGIENFCPVNYISRQNPGNRKAAYEPLFNSYIFIKVSEAELSSVRSIPYIVNFLYWKSKPVVVSVNEVDVLKQLTSNYMNMKLEKIPVKMGNDMRIIDEPVFTYSENTISIKYTTLTIELPSLGYTLTAERRKDMEQIPQPEFNQFLLLPKRLSALFIN